MSILCKLRIRYFLLYWPLDLIVSASFTPNRKIQFKKNISTYLSVSRGHGGVGGWCQCFKNFFSSSLLFQFSKLECLFSLSARKVTSQGLCYKNISRALFTNVNNKPECLSLASLYSLAQCLWARTGAYPRVETLKAALALLSSIRLGWKGLPWTNTHAYYEHS
jgi:hypothetical protein